MSWTYKFIEHTADIAVDLEAGSLTGLFISAAYAWREAVSDDKIGKPYAEKIIILSEKNLEILLVSFLSELNFLFQSESWLMNSIQNCDLDKKNDLWELSVKVIGCNIKLEQIKLKSEIKAITYHQMEIREINGKFLTRVVFDI